MKVRFIVDMAESFRRGHDCERNIVILDVDPATLPKEQRDLLASNMDAPRHGDLMDIRSTTNRPAPTPTLEGLLEPLR